MANGTSTAEITVTLKDDAGLPVAGAPVQLIISGSSNTIGGEPVGSQAFSIGDTDQDGKVVVVVLVASSLVETKLISAIGQQLTLTQTAEVVFVPGPVSSGTSSFEVAPLTVMADASGNIAFANLGEGTYTYHTTIGGTLEVDEPEVEPLTLNAVAGLYVEPGPVTHQGSSPKVAHFG